MVSTIAGSGQQGSVDGRGIAAGFDNLAGIVADAAGNLYVSDHGLIRKITPTGAVTTLAGGFKGSNPLAGTGNQTVVVTTVAGGLQPNSPLDGAGNQAVVSNQIGAFAINGAGDIYLTDTYNNIIRKLTNGNSVTTIAGDGKATSSNGIIGDLATIETMQKYIRVNVNASLLITNKLPDVTQNFMGCQAAMPDYSRKVTLFSHCANLNNIQKPPPRMYSAQVTQTPAAGTLTPNNQPIKVRLVAADSFGGVDSTFLTYIAINGTLMHLLH